MGDLAYWPAAKPLSKKNKFELKKAKKVFSYSIFYLFLLFVLFLIDQIIR